MTTPSHRPRAFQLCAATAGAERGRPAKGLIDDQGTLTMRLAEQVRRFSSALSALGLRREERVLLLMHDSSDWVWPFWVRCTPRVPVR